MDLVEIAGVILAVLLVLLAGGLWIAIALLVCGYVGMQFAGGIPSGDVLATTVWGNSASWTLAALPLFIWMGEILFRTRLSEEMFRGLAPWLDRIPGRLMHVNVLACGLFGSVSGSSAATCATVAKIALPELERRGYDRDLALGSLAGAGTLGILIPPSITMVVYAVAANVSIIQVFLAGFPPGLLVMALYSGYIALAALRHPERFPAYPADNPHSVIAMEMAKAVGEATGGKLVITVHPNATLFKAPEIKRAVATGQAQMGEVLISIHENENPIFGLDVVPFLATSFPDATKLWRAQRPAIEKLLAAQGITLLYALPWAPQGIYSAKPLASIDDMKGLKWRSYNVGTARIGEAVGAQAVTVQAAELPQALATGVVNSFMSSGATGYDSKVWETLKYFYDTQAWIPKNVAFVSTAALNGLDADTKAAILKSAADGETKGWALWQERTGWYLDQLKAKGMAVEPPSPALKAGFERIGADLTADWVKKAGAEGQAILDTYRK